MRNSPHRVLSRWHRQLRLVALMSALASLASTGVAYAVWTADLTLPGPTFEVSV